jgi:small subunit ribosomal protein S21
MAHAGNLENIHDAPEYGRATAMGKVADCRVAGLFSDPLRCYVPPIGSTIGVSGYCSLPKGNRCAVQVLVRDNNVDQALRALKKKMQREGVFREMKLRRNYEKPSERRAREKAEAVRRHRKLLRKRMDREGY